MLKYTKPRFNCSQDHVSFQRSKEVAFAISEADRGKGMEVLNNPSTTMHRDIARRAGFNRHIHGPTHNISCSVRLWRAPLVCQLIPDNDVKAHRDTSCAMLLQILSDQGCEYANWWSICVRPWTQLSHYSSCLDLHDWEWRQRQGNLKRYGDRWTNDSRIWWRWGHGPCADHHWRSGINSKAWQGGKRNNQMQRRSIQRNRLPEKHRPSRVIDAARFARLMSWWSCKVAMVRCWWDSNW